MNWLIRQDFWKAGFVARYSVNGDILGGRERFKRPRDGNQHPRKHGKRK